MGVLFLRKMMVGMLVPESTSQRAFPKVFATVAASLTVVLSCIVVYSNTFAVPFLFDDLPRIRDEIAIRTVWPPSVAMQNSNRPFAQYTFAINYAMHGYDVWGYHAVNLLIHCLAALCDLHRSTARVADGAFVFSDPVFFCSITRFKIRYLLAWLFRVRMFLWDGVQGSDGYSPIGSPLVRSSIYRIQLARNVFETQVLLLAVAFVLERFGLVHAALPSRLPRGWFAACSWADTLDVPAEPIGCACALSVASFLAQRSMCLSELANRSIDFRCLAKLAIVSRVVGSNRFLHVPIS